MSTKRKYTAVNLLSGYYNLKRLCTGFPVKAACLFFSKISMKYDDSPSTHSIFIDREAREIMRLVASVRLCVCLWSVAVSTGCAIAVDNAFNHLYFSKRYQRASFIILHKNYGKTPHTTFLPGNPIRNLLNTVQLAYKKTLIDSILDYL